MDIDRAHITRHTDARHSKSSRLERFGRSQNGTSAAARGKRKGRFDARSIVGITSRVLSPHL